MTEIVRVGVIGIGDISSVYLNNLKNYADVVKVTACASRGLEKAQKKAQEHGIDKAYASAEELIADPEIDVILNLTTPEFHGVYNMAALRAGKHVYSEKPLAASFAEGQQIMEFAREKNLYVGCAPDTFMGSRLQTMRSLIDDGTLGDITGASAFVISHGHEWHHPNPDFFYQPGAGPLLDIGPYYVTALLALLGPVKNICAMSNRAFATRTVQTQPLKGQSIQVNTDTNISAVLEFECGAVVTLVTSFDVWDSELPRMELYGTKGTVTVKDIDPVDGPNLFGGEVLLRTQENYRWVGMPREIESVRKEWTQVQIRHAFNSTSHQENFRGVGLVDMVYAIRAGRPGRASGTMALHALDVMEGILRSAQEKTFVVPTTTCVRPEPLLPAKSNADVIF
ncbi:MAG: Gfo/Idh/MocA family protein [Lachnospiraceae bacterium]